MRGTSIFAERYYAFEKALGGPWQIEFMNCCNQERTFIAADSFHARKAADRNVRRRTAASPFLGVVSIEDVDLLNGIVTRNNLEIPKPSCARRSETIFYTFLCVKLYFTWNFCVSLWNVSKTKSTCRNPLESITTGPLGNVKVRLTVRDFSLRPLHSSWVSPTGKWVLDSFINAAINWMLL